MLHWSPVSFGGTLGALSCLALVILELFLFIFIFLLCEGAYLHTSNSTRFGFAGSGYVLRLCRNFFFSFSRLTPVVEYLFDAEVSVFMRLRSYISVHLCFCEVQKRSSMGKHIFLVLKS